MTSKGTIFLTGANGGLGSAIAKRIASKSEFSTYHTLYAVRDTKSLPNLTSALTHSLPSHQHDIIALDLTKLESVRQVAGSINARISSGEIPPIRALILNAGYLDFGKQAWTEEGLDVTFAANYLGHWLLTLLLLQSMDKEAGRIVILGTQQHDPNDKRNDSTQAFEQEKYKMFIKDKSDFDAIANGTWSSAKEDPSFRSGLRRYGAAKLFLIMMMHELQQRMDQDAKLNKICILGVDPGAMISGLQRKAPWVIRVLIFKVIYPIYIYLSPNNSRIRPTSRSASDILEAAFSSGSDEPQKDLYFDGREPLETSAESRDVKKRKLVWAETVRYTRLKEGDTILRDWQ